MLPWETAPERYETLFKDKCDAVEARFAEFSPPVALRFRSPPESYRVRAEFRIWHDGDALDYVMHDPAAPRTPVPIQDFVPAISPIRELMPRLRDYLQAHKNLRRKLFQLEFMGTRAGELLVTLVYHRALDEAWERDAKVLAAAFAISVVGRSRKQKRIIGRDFVTDCFKVRGKTYHYRQYEQAFVQPNAAVNEHMLNWATDNADGTPGDLLELYCGNGNFTLPMAARFSNVIATELSKSGTRAARDNMQANGVDNTQIIRLSAEEVSEALRGEREFRRLATLPKPLTDYDLHSVFVDPPRAGLDTATLDCVREFATIFYVSCNPDTLLDNLSSLSTTHRIRSLAFFDQFPYTHHLECGVVLERR
jgi:tRNA (uracil-5-)-methyltransferase